MGFPFDETLSLGICTWIQVILELMTLVRASPYFDRNEGYGLSHSVVQGVLR